jgi:hypothetical protein
MSKAVIACLASLLMSMGLVAQTGYTVTYGTEQVVANQPATDTTYVITCSVTSNNRTKVTVWVWVWDMRGDQTEAQWNPKNGFPDFVNKGSSGSFGCSTTEKITITSEKAGTATGTHT